MAAVVTESVGMGARRLGSRDPWAVFHMVGRTVCVVDLAEQRTRRQGCSHIVRVCHKVTATASMGSPCYS